MSEIVGRRLLKRALLASTITALLPLAYVGTAHATTTTDTSTMGGTITRAQILNRLQYWVDQAVPYNQGSYHSDLQGSSYREDCSGYVSMGWHLGSNGSPDSETVFTSSPSLISSSTSTPIAKADMKPGDIINMWVPGTTEGHTLVFDGWTDSSQTHYNAYEESNPSDPTHLAGVTANFGAIPWPYWDGDYVGLNKISNAQIGAFRYNKVASDIPAGFNVAIDANGTALASGQSLYGVVNLTAPPTSQNIINSLTYNITGPNGYSTTIGGTTGANNYAYALDTAHLANGGYTISVVANEIDGQNHTYGPINFTVASEAPVSTAVINSTAHLYGVVNDGTLRTMDGDYAAGQWTNWGSLSGSGLKSVTTAVIGSTAHLYGVMNDGTLRTMDGDYAAGQWTNWGSLSGSGLRSVSAAVIGTTVHLYGVMNDGTLMTMDGDYAAGHWSNWAPLSGSGLKSVSTAVIGSKVHLYGVMNDGTLRTMDGDYAAGQWSSWGSLSGSGLRSVSTAVINSTVHLYGVMSDGTLRTMDGDYAAGQWSSWGSLSGSGLRSVSTAVMGSTAHLYGVMNDGTLRTMDGDYAAGHWTSWGSLSGSGL